MKKKIDDKKIEKAIINILKGGTKIVENKGDEDGFVLTPKACLAIALTETTISNLDLVLDDFEDKTFSEAYKLLEKRFKDNGYIVYDYDLAKKIMPLYEPNEIFAQVVNTYYPNAGIDKIKQAWNVFAYNMSVQGNAIKNK